MPFERILKDLVNKMDARGAILLDWEGESVSHFGRINDYDLKVIGAYQVVIHNLLKCIPHYEDEKINFFQLKFSSLIAQFMPINKDYFVMLMFDNKEIAAKALFHLEKVVRDLIKEIA